MYELKLYNYVVNASYDSSCTGGCIICPLSTGGACLSTCDWDTYIDGAACLACLLTCSEGCMRSTNCSPCDDEKCLS